MKINWKEFKLFVFCMLSFCSAITMQVLYDLNLVIALLIMLPGIAIGIRAWYIILKEPKVKSSRRN